jgi:hypothetical protein
MERLMPVSTEPVLTIEEFIFGAGKNNTGIKRPEGSGNPFW